MKRDERLRQLATELYNLKRQEKDCKDSISSLRSEMFKLIEYDFKGKDHLLPVRTVEVPAEFFARTGITPTDFAESRFPGWITEHIEKNIATQQITFVLKRDPDFVSRVVEVEIGDEIFQVSKQISEYAPEIDWDTLQLDRPDLYNKIVRWETTLHIDDEKLEKLIDESPEELATLQRHMRVKEPVPKLTTRKVKKDDQ